jgi:uncharacterized membrane protein YoaK (UPF0700 family)
LEYQKGLFRLLAVQAVLFMVFKRKANLFHLMGLAIRQRKQKALETLLDRVDFLPAPRLELKTIYWNQIRAEWAVGILLAVIAGYLDGYGLLFLGTYVSMMSGNTTKGGLRIGQGDFHAAFPFAVAIVFFVTGSFLGNLLSQSRLRHSHRIMSGLIASEIATVAVLQWSGLPSLYFEIALLALAMGMTNPALSKIGPESVSLTFVTGALSRVGGHLASAAGRKPLKEQQGSGDSYLTRALIEASVWCGFMAGAVLSGIAGSNSRTWALLPPCVVMLALCLFSSALRRSREKTM